MPRCRAPAAHALAIFLQIGANGWAPWADAQGPAVRRPRRPATGTTQTIVLPPSWRASANGCDTPSAWPLLALTVGLYGLRMHTVRLDVAYRGQAPVASIHHHAP